MRRIPDEAVHWFTGLLVRRDVLSALRWADCGRLHHLGQRLVVELADERIDLNLVACRSALIDEVRTRVGEVLGAYFPGARTPITLPRSAVPRRHRDPGIY